jgi:hypothetical protein
MREAGIIMEFIDFDARHVVFSNGLVLPITDFRDENGEVVEDWHEATCFDFGNDDVGYGWADIDVEPVTLH